MRDQKKDGQVSSLDNQINDPVVMNEALSQRGKEMMVKKILCDLEKKRFWKIANSPIIIWILSSVLLAIFSFCYTSVKTRMEKEKLRNDRIKQLDIEIGLRIFCFETMMDSKVIKNYCEKSKNCGEQAKYIARKLKTTPNKEEEETCSSNEIFEKRNIMSLYIELIQLVPDEEKSEIQKAFESTKYMIEELTSLAESADMEQREIYLKTLAQQKKLNNDIIIDRWKIFKILSNDRNTDKKDAKNDSATPN